ncbi:MAG: carboxypeptidase regulatory-like domain-containing protein [Acidobacteria bacterium]|nr:carboxypeptidase regulatory-like domain-containing protein [Acidobacteriota bacterium]
MRPLTPTLLALAACITLQADTTGRINGRITNKKGQPLPAAVVTLRRLDINWTKTVPVSANGTFIQVGLEPKNFELKVTCPGYADHVDATVKIPLGDSFQANVVLLTAEEAKAEAKASGKAPALDPGAKAEEEGTASFNDAVGLFNERKYAEALPLLDDSVKKFRESLDLTKEAEAKAKLQTAITRGERVLGIAAGEVFAADPAKTELAGKARLLLEKALAAKADDGPVLQILVNIARIQKDEDMLKKYQPALDKLVGPRPDLAYNEAVNHFNGGRLAEAQGSLKKAMAADPKFADSYYLLGMIEYTNMNLKATKDAFQKYLELAPTGKKAAEVKEMLNDPSLKKIK